MLRARLVHNELEFSVPRRGATIAAARRMRNPRASLSSLGLLALVAVATALPSNSLAATQRTYPSAGTCLKVDGAPTPYATANVVDTQTAAGTTSDAVLYVQPHTAGPALLAWMAGTMDNHGSRKPVQLLRYDIAAQSVTSSETLDPASIQEIDLPAFDGASDQALMWTVRLSQTTSHTAGPQGAPSCGSTTPNAKKWFANAFRLEIDGIDTSRVAKVDPIVVRSVLFPPKPTARLASDVLDTSRLRGSPPTSRTTLSSLIVTTSTSGATLPALQAWLAGDHAARNGAVVLLTPDLKGTLCTTRLTGLVITKVTVESATPQTTGRARAEMTIGGITLTCP
jgi:hypothetical protein